MILNFYVFEMNGPAQQKREPLLLRAKEILVAHFVKLTSASLSLVFKTSLNDPDISPLEKDYELVRSRQLTPAPAFYVS